MIVQGVTTAGIISTFGLPDIATSTVGAKVVLAVSFSLNSSSSTSNYELVTGAIRSSSSSSPSESSFRGVTPYAIIAMASSIFIS
jgi:hypothetical protein